MLGPAGGKHTARFKISFMLNESISEKSITKVREGVGALTGQINSLEPKAVVPLAQTRRR